MKNILKVRMLGGFTLEYKGNFTVITVKILYSSEVFMNSSAIWSDS